MLFCLLPQRTMLEAGHREAEHQSQDALTQSFAAGK
jgi:hypothetical protein